MVCKKYNCWFKNFKPFVFGNTIYKYKKISTQKLTPLPNKKIL